MNTLELVFEVMTLLDRAGLEVWLAGGWAMEARGLSEARAHHDIDLLLLAEDFASLEAFLSAHSAFTEVIAKHFSHKRAAVYRQVLVEFILVCGAPHRHRTEFFDGSVRLDWPSGSFAQQAVLGGVACPVLSSAGLQAYHRLHAEVQQAYQRFLANQETP